MERKINSTFKYKGKTYIVKPNIYCNNCAFIDNCNIKITGNCIANFRTDRTEVSFVELPKEEKQWKKI